jgi:hypothetical protein
MIEYRFFGDAYMIFWVVLCAIFLVLIPTLSATLMAWRWRQRKPIAGLLIGIGLIAALMALFWLYGTFEVERCTQTCSSGSPIEACRFSCNQESSWPFVYVAEFLLLFDILVFVIVSNFLSRRLSII